jgi:phage shock protein A
MKASTDKRLAELANKIHTTDTTIDELDERLKSELSGLQNSIQEHRDATKLKFGETDKRHGAMISRCDDLKKDIQYVKEDLEYYKNNLTKADTGNSNSIYVKSEEEGGKGDKSTLDAMRKRIEEMKR